jgi:hypothetical protein
MVNPKLKGYTIPLMEKILQHVFQEKKQCFMEHVHLIFGDHIFPTIEYILLIDNLKDNLLNISQLHDKNNKLIFEFVFCLIVYMEHKKVIPLMLLAYTFFFLFQEHKKVILHKGILFMLLAYTSFFSISRT